MGYTARKSERERESVIWKYMTYLPLVSKEGLRSKSDEVLFNDVWKWSDIAGLRDMPPKTHQKEKIFLFLFLLLLLLFSLRFEWETYKQPTERAARFFAIWFNHPHVDYDSLSLSLKEKGQEMMAFSFAIYTRIERGMLADWMSWICLYFHYWMERERNSRFIDTHNIVFLIVSTIFL